MKHKRLISLLLALCMGGSLVCRGRGPCLCRNNSRPAMAKLANGLRHLHWLQGGLARAALVVRDDSHPRHSQLLVLQRLAWR